MNVLLACRACQCHGFNLNRTKRAALSSLASAQFQKPIRCHLPVPVGNHCRLWHGKNWPHRERQVQVELRCAPQLEVELGIHTNENDYEEKKFGSTNELLQSAGQSTAAIACQSERAKDKASR